MFRADYEIQYYQNYIEACLKKEQTYMREYLYSAYYAIAIHYCVKYQRFAPVYFPTLLEFCEKKEVREEIEELQRKYYNTADLLSTGNGTDYKRKMANSIPVLRNEIIDNFLLETLMNTEEWKNKSYGQEQKDSVDQIISIIINSLQRPVVKNVNE